MRSAIVPTRTEMDQPSLLSGGGIAGGGPTAARERTFRERRFGPKLGPLPATRFGSSSRCASGQGNCRPRRVVPAVDLLEGAALGLPSQDPEADHAQEVP